ncbi:hypothetical protein [Nocardia sp. NPDC050175]|uniref:hypothetical protein n=1 Tax=Nocardia sp. NPDC050175 TaxID=3364317 RepID=UPI00379648B4
MKEPVPQRHPSVQPSHRFNWMTYAALVLACPAVTLPWTLYLVPSPFVDSGLGDALFAVTFPVILSSSAFLLSKGGMRRSQRTDRGSGPAYAALMIASISLAINLFVTALAVFFVYLMGTVHFD